MNLKELNFIINQGENQFFEFKENLDKSLSKEIVAFSNSQGGQILIGISDKGEIKEINITNSLKSKIIDLAKNCDPPINASIENYQNILIITITESKNKPHQCSTGFYLRIGPNSQKLSRNEILEFAISEGKISFDEQLNQEFKYPEDFDQNKLANYLKEIKLETNLDTKSILINLRIAKKIKKEIKFTNAGVLFFSKEPSKFHLTSKIICAEYATNKKVEILDRKIYDEGILENIKKSLNFIKKKIKTELIIKSTKRKEIPQFPEEAYREAIINSIMHRNYFDKSGDIIIENFRNKIIISNPGGLVNWLNPKDFGKISRTRNQLIANLLSKTIYVEKMGTGIQRIKNSMKIKKLPQPDFEFDKHTFITTLKDKHLKSKTVEKTVEKTVGKTVEKIIQEIRKNSKITQKELQEKTKLSRRGIEWNLKKLKEKNKINRIGSKKGGYWKII